MSGDIRHRQHVEVTFTYLEELSEDEAPLPGRSEPVIVPETYTRVRKWHVNRVFYFLTSTSALCLLAVVLAPRTPVQATALGIWMASAGLARFLLSETYRRPATSRPPEN
jgi:hypothetical protein